ncbi:hypothetical protein AB0J14_25900 [Micromonospora arborensis]|uniref:hypothetical protein n=1 Tax=Micromonospora arborensis TaxID=2116518 RepID=UPI00340C0ADF
MKIPGYEDFPLIDGTPFLAEPIFWPTYLCDTLASSDPSVVTEAFEVDESACLSYFSLLTDADRWPVFPIGLRGGHEVDVVYRNLTDDLGTEYILCRSNGEHPIDLANAGGHEFRPGLSWPELIAVASWSGAPYGVTVPQQRLLLLLPAFGDADLPADATAIVESALRACGGGAGSGELAEWLLRDPAGWPQWRQQSQGGVVCDDRYSRRNPEGPAGHVLADLLEISSALSV